KLESSVRFLTERMKEAENRRVNNKHPLACSGSSEAHYLMTSFVNNVIFDVYKNLDDRMFNILKLYNLFNTSQTMIDGNIKICVYGNEYDGDKSRFFESSFKSYILRINEFKNTE